jgi:hypothetical protein
LSDSALTFLNAAAERQIQALRETWRDTLKMAGIPYRLSGRTLELFTFAGTRINATLEHYLAPDIVKATSTAFEVSLRLHDGQRLEDIFAKLEALAQGITVEVQAGMTQGLRPLRLSKYQPFLPFDMAVRIVTDYLFEIEDAQDYLCASLSRS